MKLRIGTRGSALARAQAELAAARLRERGYETELVIVHTRGDADLTSSLAEIGRGAFTEVFSQMLRRGELDLAVHSAKDMPADPACAGFWCLPRGDARDALLRADGREIVRIGTGSPRRAAAVHRMYPAAQVLPVRGNVDTRIRKMLSGEFDALVLAAAGLDRLHIRAEGFSVERISVTQCVPAACQGIIALEGAPGACIHDAAAGEAARIERAAQRALGGSCTGGAGCYFDGSVLYLQYEGRIAALPYEGDATIARIPEAFA